MTSSRSLTIMWRVLLAATLIGGTALVAVASDGGATGASLPVQEPGQPAPAQQPAPDEQEPEANDDGDADEPGTTGGGSPAPTPSASGSPPASSDGGRPPIVINPGETIDDITMLDPVTDALPDVPGLTCRIDVTIRFVSVCV